LFNKKWDVDLVGMLASDDYVEEKTGRQAIFVNKQNSIQFNIKLISQPPENFPNIFLFTAYASDIEPFGFEEQYDLYEELRRDQVRQFFKDRLIVFKPYRRNTPDGKEVFKVSDVRMPIKPAGFHENNTYTPMPIFSKKIQGDTFETFLYKLWNKRFVGKVDNFSTEPGDTPEFILWKEEGEDTYWIIGQFERHRYAHGGFSFEFQVLKKSLFREEWYEDAFEIDDILFVGTDTYRMIKEVMERGEVVHYGNNPSLSTDFQADFLSLGAASDEEQRTLKKTVKERGEDMSICAEVKEEGSKLPDDKSEEAFLQQFFQLARDRSLLYSEKDLINFHTAMKSSTLVILAGMSGTGKSRLVEVYGRALGLDDKQLTIIPVRPSWTDDADLIGFVDSIHNVYRPGDSGLIDVLFQAADPDNQDKLYIVCFDEMNLARVEHYFSQFLSVLEMPLNRRQLPLYNEELEMRLYNSSRYRSSVSIGENVIFVGTVNLDESTYHFSDKVLDRANVIHLNVLPFSQLKELREKKTERIEPWSFTLYRSFKSTSDSFQLSDQELEFLYRLHLLLQTYKNQGIGYRIVRQIDSYLKNLPETDILSRSDAFDLQIVQRIMTKVRGPEEQLKPLLGTYNPESGENKNSAMEELLDEHSNISGFTETRKSILLKAKELRLHGYTT